MYKRQLYFFTASWSLGEQPTIEQAREAADTYTRKLGFEGLQVVWSLPVSYTHLDVYKRQPTDGPQWS